MKLLLLNLLLFSISSFAGPGHGHSHGQGQTHSEEVKKSQINEVEAKENAIIKIKVLIFQEKVDKSWEEAKFDKAQLIDVKGKKEWLVTFTNELGVKGKKLFIFLKHNGFQGISVLYEMNKQWRCRVYFFAKTNNFSLI